MIHLEVVYEIYKEPDHRSYDRARDNTGPCSDQNILYLIVEFGIHRDLSVEEL